MDTLKNTFNQALQVWKKSNRGTQFAVVAFSGISLIVIAAVGFWSLQPQYHPLASGLSPDEVAAVISRLEAQKISYELNHAGTSISVSKSQWSEARVAAGDTIVTDGGPPNLLEGSPLDPPSTQRFRMHRNLEKMLQSTISKMQSVKRATVHLSQNEEELFVRPEDTARASVQLELVRGRRFNQEQVESVVDLVSHAVVGLAPENVSVSDTQGNGLSSARRSRMDEAVEKQFEFRQRLETHLAAKAETMLSQMLGMNQAIVRVTAEIDFTKLSSEITTYDSEGRVASMETSESKSRNQATRTPIGPAGTSTNFGGGTSSSSRKPTTEKEEKIVSEFKVPQTVETLTEATGAIKRMTVAAMVDLGSLKDADGGTASTVTVEQVKALIQVATGFDDERLDSIEVIETVLPDIDMLETPVAPGGWQQIRDIVQVVSLGVASLIALIFGLITLRRIKPITVNTSDGSEAEARRKRILSEISEQAARDPESVSQIVAAWLNEPTTASDPTTTGAATVPLTTAPRRAA